MRPRLKVASAVTPLLTTLRIAVSTTLVIGSSSQCESAAAGSQPTEAVTQRNLCAPEAGHQRKHDPERVKMACLSGLLMSPQTALPTANLVYLPLSFTGC